MNCQPEKACFDSTILEINSQPESESPKTQSLNPGWLQEISVDACENHQRGRLQCVVTGCHAGKKLAEIPGIDFTSIVKCSFVGNHLKSFLERPAQPF
jgi:hypothetical protein